MKKRGIVFALVAGIFTCLLATIVFAEDFSADIVNKSKAGVFNGKIYVSKDKMRMESQGNLSITRMDKKVVWIIMPQEQMYMEQAFNPSQSITVSEKIEGEVERKLIGSDVIDGRKADKYQVVYVQNRKKEVMFQWFASGITVPVKMAAVDNSWTVEYRNINTAKQPDSLFEVPAGYKKFGMGMSGIKDMLKAVGGK